MSNQPVGILLAAGQSQRFGSNKLLHPVVENTPMLMVSAKKLANVLPASIVVINKQLESFSEKLQELGLQVVINEQAEQGMGSSIACGVKYSKDAAGWLIVLADMPYLQEKTLSLLADKLKESAGIIAPLYKKQRGHPVGFGNVYLEELISLDKDLGARNIIEKHKNQLELLAVDDKGVIKDIDHPEDV